MPLEQIYATSNAMQREHVVLSISSYSSNGITFCGRGLMKLQRIEYAKLNARQKENFNFQKISAVLADYGFVTMRLSDDWAGADFIALHINGDVLRVQLKSRLAFQEKYRGKGIWIAFGSGEDWFLYPHDELVEKVLAVTTIRTTQSWSDRGGYSFPGIPKAVRPFLEPYRIAGGTGAIPE